MLRLKAPQLTIYDACIIVDVTAKMEARDCGCAVTDEGCVAFIHEKELGNRFLLGLSGVSSANVLERRP